MQNKISARRLAVVGCLCYRWQVFQSRAVKMGHVSSVSGFPELSFTASFQQTSLANS
ncbi:hypothetical protein Hdeb2414_s0010g00335591 [Helianthus debilis subsp. tardiflorus]